MTPPLPARKTVIQDLYRVILNREAEQDGLDYHLDSSLDIHQIAACIVASPENQQRDIDWSSPARIDAIYQTFFNRHVEPGGLQFWQEQVALGRVAGPDLPLAILRGAQGSDRDAVDSFVNHGATVRVQPEPTWQPPYHFIGHVHNGTPGADTIHLQAYPWYGQLNYLPGDSTPDAMDAVICFDSATNTIVLGHPGQTMHERLLGHWRPLEFLGNFDTQPAAAAGLAAADGGSGPAWLYVQSTGVMWVDIDGNRQLGSEDFAIQMVGLAGNEMDADDVLGTIVFPGDSLIHLPAIELLPELVPFA